MKKRILLGLFLTGLFLDNTVTALAAPVTMPDGTVFDAVYYAQAYPDVTAEIGTDADALYNHYITYGRAEGRLPVDPAQAAVSTDSLVFDAVYYAQTYPDVASEVGTDANALYNHYITYGKAEGRLPIHPGINESAKNANATRKATVLSNTAKGNNPYDGKTVTIPGSSLFVDELIYPDAFSMALGNGSVLQYDGTGSISGGYVTATVADHNLIIRYDLLTSTNGTDFHRLASDLEYLFFIRNAETGETAGIFRNAAKNGGFTFPENGGSQAFDLNTASQVWLASKDSSLLPNALLPNGTYFITVGSASPSTLTASNIFTVNR